MNFKIDKEIKGLLPELAQDEFKSLERLIVEGGHVDPLVIGVIGKERILADGHNRHQICTTHNIAFDTRDKVFASKEELLQWVIDNQLGRRNLTDERRSYYMGKQYLLAKKEHGGDRKSEEISSGQNVHLIEKTAETIAEQHGVNEKTVRRNAEFAEAVDKIGDDNPDAKEQILSGKSGQTKQEVIDTAKGKEKQLCPQCTRAKRVGLEMPKNCKECKALNKPKTEPAGPPREPGDDTAEDALFLKDAAGVEVPPQAIEAFEGVPELEEISLELHRVRDRIRKACEAPCGKHIQYEEIKIHLKNAKGIIDDNKPSHVCPLCAGQIKEPPCLCCKNSGWTVAHVYKRISEEKRA